MLQAASESTIRYKNKKPLSVLDGIPIGVKDELDIKDFRTNSGRKKDAPVNEKDCATVAALRSLGVIFIGNGLYHSEILQLLVNLMMWIPVEWWIKLF